MNKHNLGKMKNEIHRYPAEQLLFNSTGKVDEKYLLTDAEWEAELAKIDCEHKTEQENV